MRTPVSLPFTLGTAQLGIPYGIGEASNGIGDITACEILDAAWSNNVRFLDTARAYGASERRIGCWMANRRPDAGMKIISKFPSLANWDSAAGLDTAFANSCSELGVSFIDIYLAHQSRDLSKPFIAERLREMVAAGSIGAFGASIYEQDEGESALGVEGLGALQLPLHLSNLAMHETGFLQRANDSGVVIFARSVFLQGLLIRPLDSLPHRFNKALHTLQRLEALASRVNSTRLALALAVVRACPGVSSVVVGSDSAAQLVSIIREANQEFDLSTILEAVEIGKSLPADLSDPRKWCH